MLFFSFCVSVREYACVCGGGRGTSRLDKHLLHTTALRMSSLNMSYHKYLNNFAADCIMKFLDDLGSESWSLRVPILNCEVYIQILKNYQKSKQIDWLDGFTVWLDLHNDLLPTIWDSLLRVIWRHVFLILILQERNNCGSPMSCARSRALEDSTG